MFELIDKGMGILEVFAPIAILGLAILTAWGVIKWGKRLGLAFMELSSNPASFVFALIVIALFMFIYFKHIQPLFG